MHLNTLKPAKGAKKARLRLGRGIGSGLGKTGGRGHKGQSSRSGGFHKVGFEGGQTPLQRRLPKSGFTSRIGRVTDEICLHELNQIPDELITLESLRRADLIKGTIKRVKIILSGELEKAVKIAAEIRVTKGAKALIEKLGGEVNVSL
jgi:large subunit ribosomal protein L15